MRSFKDGPRICTLPMSFIMASSILPMPTRSRRQLRRSPAASSARCPVTDACPLNIPPGLSPVDHDQRNTLNVGFDGILPDKFTASTNVYYGSGFTNGLYGTPQAQYPGEYLPGHTTFDLSVGKTFGDR